VRTDIQVVWTDKLEHRIIFDGSVALANELVVVDQLREEDLDLLKRKVEADAHTLAGTERYVGGLVSVLDLRGVPTVGVELVGVIPEIRVVVNMVNSRDKNCVLRDFVTSRKDKVGLCSTSRLERWVVSALHLLDILILENQTLSEISSDLGLVVEIVVNKLLEKFLLHTRVGHQAVDEPGKQGARCCEASGSRDDKSPDETFLRQFLTLVISGTDGIIYIEVLLVFKL